MNKKTIYIILGGILVAVLVGLAWWWFFNRTASTPAATQNGSFGTAQNTTSSNSVGSGTQTNVANAVPEVGGASSEAQTNQGTLSYASKTVYDPTTGVVTILPSSGATVTISPAIQTTSTSGGSASGAIWLSGSPAGTDTNTAAVGSTGTTVGNVNNTSPTIASVAAKGTVFSPTTVDLSNTSLAMGVLPLISNQQLNSTSGGLGLGGAVAGAVAAGAVACALPSLAAFVASSFQLSVLANSLSASSIALVPDPLTVKTDSPSAAVGAQGGTAAGAGTNISNNLNLSVNLSNLIQSRLLDCFARQVAKAMLQQMVKSTVSWINSGFNGSPSFVQNYNQFFTNVADQAAGNFLKSSQLSFLCSPFKLQVKIAIAQSYANRNAQSCTLTKAISNINNFMNGDFSQGGWAGMLSFTGTPTNNPYGAFAYASIGLQTAQSNAVNNKKTDLSLSGGFLSITQKQNCNDVSGSDAAVGAGQELEAIPTQTDANGVPVPGSALKSRVCDVKNVTPGTAIAQSLDKALGIGPQEASTAQYFDQIISALVGQLIQNVAYKGLSNLSSGDNGYTTVTNSGDVANSILQSILQNVPALTQSAQQSININTQNVHDIQTVLGQAQALKNCWQKAITASTTLSSAQAAAAKQNAAVADPIIADLTNRAATYQQQISLANQSIASLKNYQVQANSTTDLTNLENLMSDMGAQIQNGGFTEDADVVNGQEDQIGLQSTLTSYSSTIATSQQQCNAF